MRGSNGVIPRLRRHAEVVLNRRVVVAVVGFLLLLQVLPAIVFYRQHPPQDSREEEAHTCRHFLGEEWVVDDKARMCKWDSAYDDDTGCCLEPARRPRCQTCSKTQKCCPTYEACLCCCRSLGQRFDRCLSTCRFSSKQIDGIRFKREMHFCYK